MNKPLTIARREFTAAMNKLIAESELPFSMLTDIFRDAAAQAQLMDQSQYERDLKSYEAALKKEGENK